MPSAETATSTDTGTGTTGVRWQRGELILAIGVFVALMAALLPLLKVVDPSAWVAGAVFVPLAVLAAGCAARWYRLPAVAVSLIEAGVWVVLITLVFLRDTALVGIIPTLASIQEVPALVRQAVDEIIVGAAPLTASPALAFLIVGSMGLLAIVIDHVVITARMPLVAAVGLVAVSLIPSIAVPSAFDVIGFALLAAAVLFLLRTETRTRNQPPARPRARGFSTPASTSATALGIGAIAVIVAIVATPLLPTPASRAGDVGIGTASINPNLTLGDDLRKPKDVQVLTFTSTMPNVPYLRAVTLSSFNGKVWLPDRTDSTPVGRGAGFGDVQVDSDIKVEEYQTKVTIQNLVTQYLPIPFPAVAIDGLTGQWAVMPQNRTVIGSTTTVQGLSYEVITDLPEPTLEQIRAASARLGSDNPYDHSLPPNTPAIIGGLARQLTDGAGSDYDALVDLQNWFRGSDFTYSLTAPVRDGYDTSGVASVTAFLKQKEGYCIHFASAFAMMARELGMASRIVVGYLPGTDTTASFQGDSVYSVSSAQLHAWPEVYFQGIGWIPFEPTKSLGNATNFVSGVTGSADSQDGTDATTSPDQASPSPTTSVDANGRQFGDDQNLTSANPASQSVPWALGALGVLIVLAIPSVVGFIRRRRQDAAARDGDPEAAWVSVQETAIDLGIPVPASESARAFGRRLVREHGVPPDPMGVLIGAIEQSAYAQDGQRWYWQDAELAASSVAVRVAMLRSAPAGRRWLGLLFPRSLVVRPGSVYAGSAERVGARR